MPAVKIGAPTDVKITVLNAPPASTTEIKIVTNLDAEAEPAYNYKQHQLSHDYADPLAQAYAEKARDAAIFDIWNEFCVPIEISPTVAEGVFRPGIDLAFPFDTSVEIIFDGSQVSPQKIGTAASYNTTSGQIVSIPVLFQKELFFQDPAGGSHHETLYYSAVVSLRVYDTGYDLTPATLAANITGPSPEVTVTPSLASAEVTFGLTNIDTSRTTFPITLSSAAATTVVPVYFISTVTGKDNNGNPFEYDMVSSVQVTFDTTVPRNIPDVATMQAYLRGTPPVVTLITYPAGSTGGTSPVFAPFTVTSSISTNFVEVTPDPSKLPAINYTYFTGKTAVLPHIEAYYSAAQFTTYLGVVVPAGVPGTFYTQKVWFTKDIDILNTATGTPEYITKTITVSAMIDFPVYEYSYTSSYVTSTINVQNIPYIYDSALTGTFEPTLPVPFSLANLDTDLTFPFGSPPGIDITSAGNLIPPGAIGSPTISAWVYFTSSVTIKDSHGNPFNSSITTSVLVYFNRLSTDYNIGTSVDMNWMLTDSTFIHSWQVAGGSINNTIMPSSNPFFVESHKFKFDYPTGSSAYLVSARGSYNLLPSQQIFTYDNRILIPAANPNGKPPTEVGDIIYKEIVFHSAVTFIDVNGNKRVEHISEKINVPFTIRDTDWYVSGEVTSPWTNFAVHYSVLSEKEVGGSLDPALYNSAQVDFTPSSSAEGAYVYDRNFLNTYLSYAIGSYSHSAVTWLQNLIKTDPVAAVNTLVVVNDSGLDWPPLTADRIIETYPGSGEYLFKIGQHEVANWNLIAKELTKMDATKHGETVYARTYNDIYKAEAGIIEAFLPEWKLEGLGFAAAWDARDLNGDYIDTTGIHVEPIIIYDSLGAQHQLMIYYQKNPHMDNVWDYIITCDPLEDARKDNNNILLMSEQASFSGLIQKGKITFTGDGTDRHGGVIKDIEAQNLDFNLCKMALIGEPDNLGPGFTRTASWQNATIGGYYTGSPKVDPLTGNMMADDRTYEVLWGGVDEKKLAAADKNWQDAFSLYMEYIDTLDPRDPTAPQRARDLALYKLQSTKVLPEDQVRPGDPTSPTWQEQFILDWEAGLLDADPALKTRVQLLLPYGRNNNPLLGPTGANRPSIYDKDITTSGRTSLYWSNNVKASPATSGFTVIDTSTGERQYVTVTDKNSMGPYYFGSGLTVTFDKKDIPLRFGEPGQDGFKVGATSEQIAWTNLTPNKEGLFDFDVAFITSASMALHPPYPEGMPTIYQHISFDMGARNPEGLSAAWKVDKEMSTTQYAASNATLFKGQDGHAAGSLQRVSIGEDGVVTGIFTNGFQMELYQIGLTRFLNPWGLTKLGDNLFAETRYSGPGAMNEPGNAGTGTILANFLEQSNVDIAEEIVNMILTQRGYQANTKTVTTTDSMLEEVIHMKR